MFKLTFVTTDNCHICSDAIKKLNRLKGFIKLNIVNVVDGYEEFLLRVPVVIFKGKIIDEGKISLLKVLRTLLFKF